MQGLTAQRILEVWERGQGRSSVEQAVQLLGAACPELDVSELWTLPLGERDACVLALRTSTLGDEIKGSVRCPACSDRLMFTLRENDVRFAPAAPGLVPRELSVTVDEYEVRCRLPSSEDLYAIHALPDVEFARDVLLSRCIVEARREGDLLAPAALPDAVIDRVGDAITETDRQCEVELELSCAACRHEWKSLFDVASFFWTELTAIAQRLVQDVHALASAYGWSEAEILGMSAARRQLYLDLVGG